MSNASTSKGQVTEGIGGATSRMIDTWFPCEAVDRAVGTTAGSGRSEKALFTWFASRPIAQARAAVVTALLPQEEDLHEDARSYVGKGTKSARQRLRQAIAQQYGDGGPVVVDIFSGRGIVALEAARLGARAVGTDLSPVATLGGRLLADFPLRDWSAEPDLPFTDGDPDETQDSRLFEATPLRLHSDVATVLHEVDERVAATVAPYYPKRNGRFPWAYLWAVTLPCDNCQRRFPLVGGMRLQYASGRDGDNGQALRILPRPDGTWRSEIIEGDPDQDPTFASAPGRTGKSARCIFCSHVHSLDVVKAKGFSGQYEDAMLAVGEENVDGPGKYFREPTEEEVAAASTVDLSTLEGLGPYTAVPDEVIPPGNQDTIRASGYGYLTYGALMNPRQSLLFVATVRAIRSVHADLVAGGVGREYAAALAGYAAANMQRRLRRSTRGAKLSAFGGNSSRKGTWVQVHDVFADESKVSFQFDYLESGPGTGPGTWDSVTDSGLQALKKVIEESSGGTPARFRQASAVALPFRDGTVDAVITDPPYYNMIDYSDASDLFHVWLKRCLFDIFPDLFDSKGLQDKTEEIIVKRGGGPEEHRTREFYERMLSRAFAEAKRVLRPDGHLVVVFGHSDTQAWRRLLRALHDAGFIVTSSWPSRTETSSTGVASIKVTVAIGCRVAPPRRPTAIAAQVDREVAEAVKAAVPGWERDGLAYTDQLMASIGRGMEVYGRYSKILKPDGSEVDLERYLSLAGVSVRDAIALKLDELPLETFDARTRFAVFWQRVYGLGNVAKGEALFLAQADGLRFDDVRSTLLKESKSGFRLRLDPPQARPASALSTFEVALAMAGAWDDGGTEAVAQAIADAEHAPNDPHLWAVVGDLVRQLPPSDRVAKALTAVQRNAPVISSLAAHAVEHHYSAQQPQAGLFDLPEESHR